MLSQLYTHIPDWLTYVLIGVRALNLFLLGHAIANWRIWHPWYEAVKLLGLIGLCAYMAITILVDNPLIERDVLYTYTGFIRDTSLLTFLFANLFARAKRGQYKRILKVPEPQSPKPL